MRPEAYVTPQHQLALSPIGLILVLKDVGAKDLIDLGVFSRGCTRSWPWSCFTTLRAFNQLCGKFDRSTRCSSMQERNQVGHAWMATGTMDTKHHLLDSLQALANWGLLQVQSSPAQGQSMLRLFTTRSFLTFPGVGHCFGHRLTELQRVVGRCLSHLPSVEA